MKCYKRATGPLGFCTYAAFESAWNKCEGDQGLKTKWAECISRESMPDAAAAWNPGEVGEVTAYQVLVSKDFRGYNAESLKDRLGMSRLTQKASAGVHTIVAPDVMLPNQDEEYFLFAPEDNYEAEDPGVDIRVQAVRTCQMQKCTLAKQGNLHEAHAVEAFGKQATKNTCFAGLQKAMNAKKEVPTLNEFVTAFMESRDEKNQPPTKKAQKLTGAAVKEFMPVTVSSVSRGGSSADFHQDLSDQHVEKKEKTPINTKLKRTTSSRSMPGTDAGEAAGSGSEPGEDSDEPDSSGALSIELLFLC